MKKAAPSQQCHGIESHNRNETSATQNKLLQISSHTPARTRQRQNSTTVIVFTAVRKLPIHVLWRHWYSNAHTVCRAAV